jgi:hypothetical protein
MSDLKGSDVALFLEEKFNEPLKDHSHWKRKKSDLKGKEFIWVMLSLHQELMPGFTCENPVAGNIPLVRAPKVAKAFG